MAMEVPSVSFTIPAMPAQVTACVLPSVPGLTVSSEPAQLHPITYQLGQASVWQGVPGPLGTPGQLVQLSCGVQLPAMVQLPPMVQLPQVPAYSGGQQVVMGTLVPNQPMGLGPWAMVQGEPLYPTGSCSLQVPAQPGPPPPCRPPAQHWVQGPPVLHTPPSSAQNLSEASNKDGVAIEDSISATSPHQTALAPITGRTTTKPKGEFWGYQSPQVDGQAEDSLHCPWVGLTLFAFSAAVTNPAAPGEPADLPKQGPATFAEAFAEQAEDTTLNHKLAWLNTTDGEDTIPDVPDSPSLTAFLHELPDLSEYVAEGGSTKERAAVVGLGNSENTVPDDPDMTAFLNELPDLCEYVVKGGCPKDLTSTAFLNEVHNFSEYVADGDCCQDQAVVARLGDSEDTNLTTKVLDEVPDLSGAEGGCNREQVAAVMLVDGENTFPDVPDSLASTTFCNEVPDFLEYGEEGDCSEDRLAAAMLGDTDPFWGVAASPLQDPRRKQGGLVADLPTWLPLCPLGTSKESSPESSRESSEESPEDSPVESPWKDPLKTPPESPLLSPLQIPLLSPLGSPPTAPQHHLPRMAQLVEEALQRQPRVVLTRLPVRAGVVSCWLVPRSGETGSKKAKRPTPASTPKMQVTSLQDNMPPKKKKKMVVRQQAKH
ncbi:hypothetical protein QYF61_013856 [Mycteria americana]|uniref:Uncharacterized protein n=1 Tax=Mycteria americana TaxID=33587 RepID=A0AAN7N8H2_MYCAM|nr:hypothetical protein QYF61_013856 [Mycteria americana]